MRDSNQNTEYIQRPIKFLRLPQRKHSKWKNRKAPEGSQIDEDEMIQQVALPDLGWDLSLGSVSINDRPVPYSTM